MKRALITGVTGQDGRHLSEYLLEQGYQVFGLQLGVVLPAQEPEHLIPPARADTRRGDVHLAQ